MRRLLMSAAAAAVLAPAALAAQQPVVLTLEEAQRLARAHNPEFQRTDNDLNVAGNSIRSAWGAFLPNLNTSMSFSGSNNTRVTGEDDFGRPIRLEDPRTFQSSSASQSIGASMTLFDGGTSLRNLQSRRASYGAVEAQIDAQRIQLDSRVAREFYASSRAVRNIALEEALLASAQDRLERTDALMRLAARSREDVLGARADVAQAEQNLQRARGEADKARLTVAATLGMQPSTSVTVDTLLPAVFDPAQLDVQALVSRSLATSPLIRQREAALRAARYSASAARGRRLPTINANAGYGRSMSLSNYGAFGELNPQNYGYNFGMSVSLPLFSRFQTAEAIAQASASAQDAEHDLQAARLTVERDVRAALIDLENAYRSLLLAEQQVELSRERQELAQERYRLGGYDFAALQTVIDRTAQAERQALEARFGFINARITLEERLGHRLEN